MGVAGRVKNGELLLAGDIKQRTPMVQAGLVAHYPMDGTVRGTKATKNLVSMDVWQVGTSGTQGYFWQNGTAAENQIITYANPFGIEGPMWATLGNDAGSNDDGGWAAFERPIDNTKKYRLSVWIRRENVGNGTTYFGCQGNTVHGLGGAVDGNPYFLAGNFTQTHNNWVLFVGYIQPHTYASALNDPTNGLYTSAGVRIGGATDYKWAPTATVGGIRSYLYYSTAITERQYWWDPRMEVCDGTEASVSELIAGRNESISPSVNTSTTLTDSYMAVEEATTNYLSTGISGHNGANLSSWTGDGTLTQVGIANTGSPIFRYATAGSSYRYTVDQVLNDDLATLSGKTVTFSLYVRRLEGPGTGQIRFYDNISGYSYKLINTTQEFQHFQMTKVLGASPTRIFAMIDSTGGGTYEFHSSQLEIKPFATSYVNGSRGTGRFDIPFTLKPPYTVNVWHKGIKPLAQVTDQGSSPMIFQLGNYYGNASVSFWNYVKNLSIYIKGNASGGWTSTFQPYNFTDAKWDNKEHMYTLVAVDNRTFKVYVDGVFVGQGTSSEDVTNITYLSMGNTSMPNAQYRALSLYDRAITDEEAKRLYGQPYDITSKGHLIVRDFVEKPNGIPIDTIHVPLDVNAKDRMSRLSPSTETGVIYRGGSTWIGTAVTNLYRQAVSNSDFPARGSGIFTVKNTGDEIEFQYEYNQNLTWTYHGQTIAVTNGVQYRASMDVFISADANMPSTGSTFVANMEGSCATAFYYDNTKKGTWQHFDNVVVSTGASTNLYLYPCTGTTPSTMGHVKYKNVMVTTLPFTPAFVDGTRPASKLEFNLNRDHGLSWAADWSIVYWKKPIGTYADNLAAYNLESLGSNSNSVGGGYAYFGKDNGANAIFGSSPGTITPANYFGKWRMISLSKTGTTITVKEWEEDGTVHSRSIGTTNTVANYFVNQHGYDFKLGGWDAANPCNNYYKDLVIAKRALTDAELTAMHKTHMRVYPDRLQIQSGIKTNQIIT